MAPKRWWCRPVVIVLTAIVAVTALTLKLAALQPWRLFIDVTVDEALPSVAVEEIVKPSSDAFAEEAARDDTRATSAVWGALPATLRHHGPHVRQRATFMAPANVHPSTYCHRK